MKWRSKAPCLNCPKRSVHPNCHTTCKEYLEYSETMEYIREERSKFVRLEGDIRAVRKKKGTKW